MSEASKGSSRKKHGGGGEQRYGFAQMPPQPNESDRRAWEKEAYDTMRTFLRSGASTENLPIMDRQKRKFFHEIAKKLGIHTKSHGTDPNRFMEISLKLSHLSKSVPNMSEAIVPLPNSLEAVTAFVVENPISKIEMEHFLSERPNKLYQPKGGSLRMKPAIPPEPAISKEIRKTKEALPVTEHRNQLLKSIARCDVTIISGGTGCGKTTQVPQFIMEDACDKKVPIRLMCTQPRRIAAISISERVAKERGERVGDYVGFQVRLDSKQSENTILTYCTTGVLLRMLTSDPIATGITHIIMDEIHEREINTDYLLIALRQCFEKRSDLKVILMSATIEGSMALFAKYFRRQKVEIARIESRTFEVKHFYLDEILAMSGYEPPPLSHFLAPYDFDQDEWQEELQEVLIEERQKAKEAEARIQQERAFQQMQMQAQMLAQIQAHLQAQMPNQMPVQILSGYPQNVPFYPSQMNTSMMTPISATLSGNYPQEFNKLLTVDTMDQSLYAPQYYMCNEGNGAVPSGDYTDGPYQTIQGEVIEERNVETFWRAVGRNTDMRPVTFTFKPASPNSIYLDDVRYTLNPNQSPTNLKKHAARAALMPDGEVNLLSQLPIKKVGTESTEFPDSPVSPEALQSGKSGLGRLASTEFGFGGFGERQKGAELVERKFREQLKTAIANRPLYYHHNVLALMESVDFAKLRLGDKYNMFYGRDYKNAVDHHLLDHVVKYLADSPVFGSILVFLPGYDDIQIMMDKIGVWKEKLTNYNEVIVIPLHSQMHSVDNGQIFKSVATKTRKIILATNIAEASITIEDVIFVVDTGKAKEKSYDHEAKLSTLSVGPIARSNAEQRSGRAGRCTNGYCIRLYTQDQFNEMPETQLAEMKRAAIYDVTLHAKLFAPNGTKISEFLSLAPEPPSPQSIEQSMEFLEQIGAFYAPSKYLFENQEGDDEEDDDQDEEEVKDPELTDLGRLMARLPLDPQLSRMLLFGLALKCFAPIVNLVAMLANRDAFVLTTSENRDEQNRMKNQSALTDFSDHLMLIRVCSNFSSLPNTQKQAQFCRQHFLNFNTMRMVLGTRRQLIQELVRAKIIYIPQSRDLLTLLCDNHFNVHAVSWPMVQAAIAAGCYPNIGVSPAESRLRKVHTFSDRPAGLHSSSIVKKQVLRLNKQGMSRMDPRLEFVAFQELSQMSDLSLAMRTVTVIPSITALMFTGPIRISEQLAEEHNIIYEPGEHEPEGRRSAFETNISHFELDTWYSVRADKKTLCQFLRLRHKFMHFFLQGISDPSKFGQDTPQTQLKMLETVRILLESEHQRYNYDRVEMPCFYLRDFPRHTIPYQPQRNKNPKKDEMTEQQMRDLQRAINQVGESVQNSQSSSRPEPDWLPSGQFSMMNQMPLPPFIPHQTEMQNNPNFRGGHRVPGGFCPPPGAFTPVSQPMQQMPYQMSTQSAGGQVPQQMQATSVQQVSPLQQFPHMQHVSPMQDMPMQSPMMQNPSMQGPPMMQGPLMQNPLMQNSLMQNPLMQNQLMQIQTMQDQQMPFGSHQGGYAPSVNQPPMNGPMRGGYSSNIRGRGFRGRGQAQ